MAEATYKEVASYYNELWAQLEKESLAGINRRHRMILHKLKKAGLKKDSRVLEIGCGIGTLTQFIAKSIPKGKIVGVDISPDSIEFARKKYSSRNNIEFVVSDMTQFNYTGNFDIILFPDVLEHIPVEAHENIFKTVSKIANDKAIIAINLPEPRAARWYKKNQPEILQIIDLDIETDFLVNTIYPNGFYLYSHEPYSLWINQPEYEWMIFRKKAELPEITKKSKLSLLLNGIKLRIV